MKQQKLLALYAYVSNECSFTEYLSSAKLEQKKRCKTVEKKLLKEHQRQAKLQEEAPTSPRTYDNTSKNITKAKQESVTKIMGDTEKK